MSLPGVEGARDEIVRQYHRRVADELEAAKLEIERLSAPPPGWESVAALQAAYIEADRERANLALLLRDAARGRDEARAHLDRALKVVEAARGAAGALRLLVAMDRPLTASSQALLAAVDAYNTPRGRQVAEPRRWEAVVIPDEVRVVADDYGGRWVRLLRNPALYSRPVYDLWEHDAPHAEREGGPLTTGQLLEGFGPISEVASAP